MILIPSLNNLISTYQIDNKVTISIATVAKYKVALYSTSTSIPIRQLLYRFRDILINPFSPQFSPQLFFTIQYSLVYPTSSTAWSSVTLDLHFIIPPLQNSQSYDPTPTIMGEDCSKYIISRSLSLKYTQTCLPFFLSAFRVSQIPSCN